MSEDSIFDQDSGDDFDEDSREWAVDCETVVNDVTHNMYSRRMIFDRWYSYFSDPAPQLPVSPSLVKQKGTELRDAFLRSSAFARPLARKGMHDPDFLAHMESVVGIGDTANVREWFVLLTRTYQQHIATLRRLFADINAKIKSTGKTRLEILSSGGEAFVRQLEICLEFNAAYNMDMDSLQRLERSYLSIRREYTSGYFHRKQERFQVTYGQIPWLFLYGRKHEDRTPLPPWDEARDGPAPKFDDGFD